MKPVLITVNGTGVPDPFGPGFSGDIGRAFAVDEWAKIEAQLDGRHYDEPPIFWQPIGYPADVFPMQDSIDVGRDEVKRQIRARPKGTPIAMSGYSQGACVVGEVWTKDFLDDDGEFHDRVDDVFAIINFGDPFRCPGVANGNKVAGKDQPDTLDGETTGGIAGPGCLTRDQTLDFVLSCALDGDLYSAAPVGDNPWDNEPLVGEIETYIYDFVLSGDAGQGFMDIVEHVADTFTQPITSIVAHCEAIFNGLKFAAAGTDAPHWQYQDFVPPLVDWLTDHAAKVTANATAS